MSSKEIVDIAENIRKSLPKTGISIYLLPDGSFAVGFYSTRIMPKDWIKL